MNREESENTNKNFDQIPKDYLSGIFIVPHNFDQPENPNHALYVNEQTRYDLFYDAYQKIMDIESKYLKNEEDYFRLKKIKTCGEKTTWIEKYLTKKHTEDEEDNLLRCEDWIIEKNGVSEDTYRVKTYQSNSDRFFTLVFPSCLKKYFQLYRTHGGPI